MRINIIIIIVVTILVSCNTDDRLGPNEPIAYAGPDQTCKVGQYVILDATKSTGGRGGNITTYEWTQDENNPAKVNFKLLENNSKAVVGFSNNGIYKFSLRVKNNLQYSAPHEVVVRVYQRDNIIFECPNLEISVRYKLNKPDDELSEADFLSLDSLRFFSIVDDITSLKGIERCENLVWLNLSLQKITDLSPLSNLKKLEYLALDQNNNIKNLSPISGLDQLRFLYLDQNDITDISPLKNLIHLTFLQLCYNTGITDISAIANMNELEHLYMSNSPISDISPVAEFKNLLTLWIDHCEVTDISPIANLKKLKVIKFDLNPVGDITAVKNLTELEWLYLADCNISDISPIENLVSLKRLRLWNNQITDILPLVNNRGLGPGDIVALDGNPLNEKSINDYIPDLQFRGVFVSW